MNASSICRRCIAYETAILHNIERAPGEAEMPLPMEAGTYSNHANVLQGYLKTLGLERQSRPTETLRDLMRAEPEPKRGAEPASDAQAQAVSDEMIRANEASTDTPADEPAP